jgi:hypothetical protein
MPTSISMRICILIAASLLTTPPMAQGFLPAALGPRRSFVLQLQQLQETKTSVQVQASTSAVSLEAISEDLEKRFAAVQGEITKTWKVKVAPVSTDRLGLIATQSISKGEVIMAMPYDDKLMLSARVAKEEVFRDLLPASYDSWTGETGLIALMILNEVARAAGTGTGVALPERPAPLQTLIQSWVNALPSPQDMEHHPLMWPEQDQEVLQSSSTNKIYRQLDDLEEDASWLTANVFDKDRTRFPETVTWNNDSTTIPCFSLQGLKWAMALALSRSCFINGSLKVIPVMDMCNHDDDCAEVQAGSMGTLFGSIKGAQLLATKPYKAGEQVFCSYGPKSAADYLLEHGFCPEQCWKMAVSELVFEVDRKIAFVTTSWIFWSMKRTTKHQWIQSSPLTLSVRRVETVNRIRP